MSALASGADLQALLVRHAETPWSREGRHTGRTDVPLTDDGRAAAAALGPHLRGLAPALVLCSPLRRARETCELCGFGGEAEIDGDLAEWDYGDYEGLTTPEILERDRGWVLWRDGCPAGEDAAAVGARADRVLGRLRGAGRPALLFAHGHLLRVLGARWAGLEPAAGALLMLSPACMGALGLEHGRGALAGWNLPGSALAPAPGAGAVGPA